MRDTTGQSRGTPGIVDLAMPELGHYELMARWLSRPEDNRWLFPELRGHTVTATHVRTMLISPRNRLWLVCRDDTPVGMVGFNQIDPGDRTAAFWLVLGDHGVAGRGVMTRAAELAIERGFSELGLHSIRAYVAEPNEPVHRLNARLGMRRVGAFTEGTMLDGVPTNLVVYEILRGTSRSVPIPGRRDAD